MSQINLLQENLYDTPMDQAVSPPKKLYLSGFPAKAEKFVFSSKCTLSSNDYIQIVFVVSGSGKLFMNGAEHQIKQGTIAILEGGTSMEFVPTSPVVVYSCSFVPELFGCQSYTYALSDIKDDPALSFFFENDIGIRITPRIPRIKVETFQKLLNDMITESEAHSPAHKHLMRLWVSELLIRIAEVICSDKITDDSVSDTQLVQLITNFIKNNYAAKHTYDSLARMA